MFKRPENNVCWLPLPTFVQKKIMGLGCLFGVCAVIWRNKVLVFYIHCSDILKAIVIAVSLTVLHE